MKCDDCKFLWSYSPDYTSPYGEFACMANGDGKDLYGCTEEDVKDCEDYVKNEYAPIA